MLRTLRSRSSDRVAREASFVSRRIHKYPFGYGKRLALPSLHVRLFVILVFSFKRFLPLLFLHRVV